MESVFLSESSYVLGKENVILAQKFQNIQQDMVKPIMYWRGFPSNPL